MHRQDPDPGAEEVRRVVEAAARTFGADSEKLEVAFGGVSGGASVPLRVFRVIADTRRHALAAFRSVVAIETEHPAKGLALTWLSLAASATAAFYRALRAEQSAPKKSREQHALARERYRQMRSAALELDRGLGCPFGCKEPS